MAVASMWDQIVVDRGDEASPYRQIANALRHQIATNQIPPATELPSVRSLATRVGVTPATVSRAYRLLQSEGLVESQVGVGTVVGDTHQLVFDTRHRSAERLDAAIDGAIGPLLEIGYSATEVRGAVERRLAKVVESRHALLISDAKPVLHKYLTILRRELTPLGVQVEGVLLADLAAGDREALGRLRRTGRVLLSLGLLRQVVDLLHTLELDPTISVIFTELRLATIERLSRIRPNARTLLVAEERYRNSILGILRTHLPSDQVAVLHQLDETKLREALEDCDVVVHSLGQSDLVRGAVSAHHDVILMDYQARQDALTKLRASFAAMSPAGPA